jgi:soluble lytic murein transglycosylase-like protein
VDSRQDYVDYAIEQAEICGVPTGLFLSQIDQESGFQPDVSSGAGAVGIAQIVPQYHPTVDPTDPYASLVYAAKLMASHYGTYHNWVLALVAYNGGGGAVGAWTGGQPYDESRRYVQAICGRTAAYWEYVKGQEF